MNANKKVLNEMEQQLAALFGAYKAMAQHAASKARKRIAFTAYLVGFFVLVEGAYSSQSWWTGGAAALYLLVFGSIFYTGFFVEPLFLDGVDK